MYILDCNEKMMCLKKQGRNPFGGESPEDTSSSREIEPLGTCDKAFDNKTELKEGFNAHSLILPNGCKTEVKESGEVFIQEDGGKPKKIRHKDSLQSKLIQ